MACCLLFSKGGVLVPVLFCGGGVAGSPTRYAMQPTVLQQGRRLLLRGRGWGVVAAVLKGGWGGWGEGGLLVPAVLRAVCVGCVCYASLLSSS
jgi:hypothetical protein